MQKNRGIIATVFLALVAIIIFLFAIGYFTESRPFGFSNYKKALRIPCGIEFYAPKEDSVVTFPYKVYGYAGGCGWDPITGGAIGTIEVIAPNGLIISSADLITKDSMGDSPYYFETIIDVPVSFVQESGLFIIKNHLLGLESKEIKIPVRFASHL